MRTTLDIDDDLLAAARDLSRQQGRTAGQVISALLRQALTSGTTGPHTAAEPSPQNGFRPFASRGTPVTNAVIDALRDAEGTWPVRAGLMRTGAVHTESISPDRRP